MTAADAPLSDTEYLKRILRAQVYDVAEESPLQAAPLLSSRINNEVLLKREDLQPVFSFKLRGAYNKMASLSPEKLAKGVICSSAGNHAQGVALAATRLGTSATIVMPTTTPDLKVNAVRARGGTVVLHGEAYDDAYAHARDLERKHDMTFIHPFDDPDVIAGQGTIGMEILRQRNTPLDAIFIAVGGGGLLAGVATYVKQVRPGVRIIAVQSVDSDAMCRSLESGQRVKMDNVGLFADGVAVRLVGEETFRLAQQFVDEWIRVTTDEICAAIKDVFEDTRSIVEPAGALAVAGVKAYARKYHTTGKTYVAIACGANMNFDRLRFVSERAEVGEMREALFCVTLPERPQALKGLVDIIGKRNVTEFNYRMNDPSTARIFLGVAVTDKVDSEAFFLRLEAAGTSPVDLTANELAKTHARHMVGGHCSIATNEQLCRFEFPERPGALMRFLTSMSPSWNISLFHYRNQGSDVGRVLMGIQVSDEDLVSWNSFLETLGHLGYRYYNENQNPAYDLFLR